MSQYDPTFELKINIGHHYLEDYLMDERQSLGY